MLVTDAMPPAGGTRSTFPLYGEQIATRGEFCITEAAQLRARPLIWQVPSATAFNSSACPFQLHCATPRMSPRCFWASPIGSVVSPRAGRPIWWLLIRTTSGSWDLGNVGSWRLGGVQVTVSGQLDRHLRRRQSNYRALRDYTLTKKPSSAPCTHPSATRR